MLLEQKITPIDIQQGDNFGTSVVISENGQYMVTGAWRYDSQYEDVGIVYVYKRNHNTWSLQQKLQPSDKQLYKSFGRFVDISYDGSVLVVGTSSRGFDTDKAGGHSDSGSIYVFTRDGDIWSQNVKLQPDDHTHTDAFGVYVSISGDGHRIAASATGSINNKGAIYTFIKSGNTWKQESKIQPNDDYTGLGIGLAISGDGQYISSRGSNVKTLYGETLIFVKSGNGWKQQANLKPQDLEKPSRYGMIHSMSHNGVYLVTGALYASSHMGEMYIFKRSGSSWELIKTVRGENKGDLYASHVSISSDGKYVISGAFGYDNHSGKVYIYQNDNDIWDIIDTHPNSEPITKEFYGSYVDINSHGEYAVGVNLFSVNKQKKKPSVYIYFNSEKIPPHPIHTHIDMNISQIIILSIIIMIILLLLIFYFHYMNTKI